MMLIFYTSHYTLWLVTACTRSIIDDWWCWCVFIHARVHSWPQYSKWAL